MDEYTVASYPSSARPLLRASAPIEFAPTKLVTTILAIAALTISILGGALPAHADDTIGIAAAPADGTKPDGRTRFSYQVAPGQTISDFYQVTNSGSTAQTVTVLGTDAFNTPDGSYGLLDSDAKAVDSGSWVTFAAGSATASVTLAPKESQIVPFTVTVPADASPGDHAGGIVVSAVSPDGQILVDRRVATRLYVRVPGDLQANLTIASFTSHYNASLNPFDGTTTITMTVKNAGNVALAGLLAIGVKTYNGIQIGEPQRPAFDELLPGNTRKFSITIKGIPAIGYLNPYVSLAPTVSPDALNPGTLGIVRRDIADFAMPWWLLIILGAAAIIVAIVRIRRRVDARRAAAWIAHVEAEARQQQ